MGNQNSRSTPQSPTNANVSAHASHERERPSHARAHQLPHSHYHSARRRESIQALNSAKAQAAPPSASLENVESHPTSTRPPSRGRSQTVASSINSNTSNNSTTTTTTHAADQLRAATDSFRSSSHDDAMGNEQSSQKAHKEREKEKEKERERERDKAQTTPPHLQPAQIARAPSPSPSPSPSSQTRPVDVPAVPQHIAPSSRTEPQAIASPIDPAGASQDYIPSAHFSRPPRLPLPIEEELHTPGSPIISPQDLSSGIDHGEVEGLPRRASMLSTTTADDEDLGDEFRGPSTGRPTVPTLIEWEGPGERVYVTGTFANWDRKYRLHHNGPSEKKGALSAYVYMTPGTHHVTFLVDNEMKTSDNMPSAVDYTNMLVNYVEVAMPAPAAPASKTKEAHDADATSVQERDAPTGVYPPQVLPPTPEIAPVKAPLPEPPVPVVPEPSKKYHQNIPRYLLDLDAPEESSRFARANAMTNNLPTPPTLPGFLGKSILNGTTPMKDDSSVLIHPNHTVLNHLATSSIKDNILATSATTRYKQKFLTTIMYKPKEESGEHVY